MVLLGGGRGTVGSHRNILRTAHWRVEAAPADECFTQLNGLSDRLPRCRLWTDIRTGDFGCYRKSENLCGRRPTGRVLTRALPRWSLGSTLPTKLCRNVISSRGRSPRTSPVPRQRHREARHGDRRGAATRGEQAGRLQGRITKFE